MPTDYTSAYLIVKVVRVVLSPVIFFHYVTSITTFYDYYHSCCYYIRIRNHSRQQITQSQHVPRVSILSVSFSVEKNTETETV